MADKGIIEMTVDTDPIPVMRIYTVSFLSSQKSDTNGKRKGKKVHKQVWMPK